MKNLALAAAALTLAAPALAIDGVTTYESFAEQFLGGTFSHNGVTYHTCNDVGGVFPDGSTFVPDDIGFNFIIENSTFLFNDYPTWGSPNNTLTFGTAYVVGDNLSLGAFARATMDLASPSNSVGFDMVFYENGPWGGIVFHCDVLRNGAVVGTDSLTIANGGGRDNIAFGRLEVTGVEFDQVKIYAKYGDQYSAPRLMIDNLTFGQTPACGTADFDGDGDVGTDADIEAFFACLAGNCCATCYSGGADFDADGDVGTDADIESFFRVLAGGPC
jgi:hypothetical protein